MSKKKEVKRTLVLDYVKEPVCFKIEREIGKAVEIDITDPTRSFMFMELMKDGKWRLTWSKNFLHDGMEISNLKSISIDRGDKLI